jgi:hypothetical protein
VGECCADAVAGRNAEELTMGQDYLLQFFEYKHLPIRLQEISKPFCDLARQLVDELVPANSEQHMALRKLLEAKDCAVRARLMTS